MLFKEIPGLDEIKKLLITSVKNNHVAHAQLFHGAPGAVALPMALAFATYLNCNAPTDTDACGVCSSCVMMQKLAHPDVIYVYPTAGGKKVLSENFIKEWRAFVNESPFGDISDWLERIEIKQGNIPVEDTRQIIQKLSLKSYEGGQRIVMIWMPEFMGASAANALLKVLEEPPSKTVFLLITNAAENLLTTIISRTQRMAIRNLTDSELIEYLSKSQNINSATAQSLAFLAEGNIKNAIDIIEKKDENEKEWFANWMRYCYAFDLVKLVSFADEFDSITKESQRSLLTYGLKMIRQIYLQSVGVPDLIKLDGEELEFITKFSKVFKFENIETIASLISEAQFTIERNARAKFVFLDTSLQMAKYIK